MPKDITYNDIYHQAQLGTILPLQRHKKTSFMTPLPDTNYISIKLAYMEQLALVYVDQLVIQLNIAQPK